MTYKHVQMQREELEAQIIKHLYAVQDSRGTSRGKINNEQSS